MHYIVLRYRVNVLRTILFSFLVLHVTTTQSQTVTSIDWNRFTSPALSPFQGDVRLFTNKLAGYNLNWVEQRMATVATPQTPSGRRYDMQAGNESEIRPLSHIVYSTAVLLKTGGFDATLSGFDETTFRNRTIEMIHGAALEHTANNNGVQWGNSWQSALWAAHLAEGAWIIWDDLPDATRNLVTNMTVYEANRFTNYDVPYWANPNGTFNSPGDTKAEENAWNSRMLSVAVAMMPDHANSLTWRTKSSELLVSSYARPSDLQNPTVLDGQAVQDWIDGYNAYETGFVENHGFIHNDYHATTGLTIQPFITQSLAGQTIPQTARFNADVVYNAMATIPVGSQQKPMFQRGPQSEYIPDLYYPQGTDWSYYRYDIFLEMDAYAEFLGIDSDKSYDATGWAEVRLDRLLEMQARHPDGHLYASGEFDNWSTREAYALQTVTNIWMLDWLDAQDQISAQGNWINDLYSGGGSHLVLSVNRTTGEVVLFNKAHMTDVALEGYAIRSATGQLNPAAWQNLASQGLGDWITANSANAQLGELKATGATPFAPAEQITLGQVFSSPVPTTFGEQPVGDLTFQYTTSDNRILHGPVIYTGTARNVTLSLVVDPVTGRAELRNDTPFLVEIEGYRITSTSGALQPADGLWNSLTDQSVDGGSWVEANPSTTQLAELNAGDATALITGSVFDLGHLYDTTKVADLSFYFVLFGETEARPGIVIYEPLGLPGDYNGDGLVDAADYSAWRDNFGAAAGTLPNDVDGGAIGQKQYETWKAEFGATTGIGNLSNAVVPEPECLSLTLLGLVAVAAAGVNRRSH